MIIETGQDLNQDSDLSEFQNAHTLLLEINKFAPSILLSVIPQLEEEMKVDYKFYFRLIYLKLEQLQQAFWVKCFHLLNRTYSQLMTRFGFLGWSVVMIKMLRLE